MCGHCAEGMGPSKKVAKRNAAEKMLELLGFKVPPPQPHKPALKTDERVQYVPKSHRRHTSQATGLVRTLLMCSSSQQYTAEVVCVDLNDR